MQKKIIYTESAQLKLEKSISNLRNEIEVQIKSQKNFPGEEIIEITASDIEDAFDRVRLRPLNSNNLFRSRTMKVILPIYFVFGVLITLYGFFYDTVKELILNDSKRLTFVLVGFTISLTTAAMYYILKQRELERKKEEEILRYQQRKEEYRNVIVEAKKNINYDE